MMIVGYLHVVVTGMVLIFSSLTAFGVLCIYLSIGLRYV